MTFIAVEYSGRMAKLSDFELQLGDKCVLPLVIGGMGVDISTSDLALEAARLGGVGHISDAMSPYVSDSKFGTKFQSTKRREFVKAYSLDNSLHAKWDPEPTYKATYNQVQDTMGRKKGDGLVFINVMEKLTMGNPCETLRARLEGALDGGIDGITLSAGLHNSSLRLISDHSRFRDAKIGIIVSSLRALKIFLRGAKRVNRLPDYVVVEGPLAGGHLGFGEDWKEQKLENIVSDIIQYLSKEQLPIAVIPAGGVFTGTDAVNFIKSGASALQVATRFTISKECGLPDVAKQSYLQANEEDVEVNLSSPTGYFMRMIKSSPSLQSNVKPNCDTLGYLLDREGNCQYRDAWERGPVDERGVKLPISEKMCICYHFMRHQCYTCGHYVYRLKETTERLPNGEFYLPPMEHIFNDYMESEDFKINVAKAPSDSVEKVTANS